MMRLLWRRIDSLVPLLLMGLSSLSCSNQETLRFSGTDEKTIENLEITENHQDKRRFLETTFSCFGQDRFECNPAVQAILLAETDDTLVSPTQDSPNESHCFVTNWFGVRTPVPCQNPQNNPSEDHPLVEDGLGAQNGGLDEGHAPTFGDQGNGQRLENQDQEYLIQ